MDLYHFPSQEGLWQQSVKTSPSIRAFKIAVSSLGELWVRAEKEDNKLVNLLVIQYPLEV